jgi:hypothetical protein
MKFDRRGYTGRYYKDVILQQELGIYSFYNPLAIRYWQSSQIKSKQATSKTRHVCSHSQTQASQLPRRRPDPRNRLSSL